MISFKRGRRDPGDVTQKALARSLTKDIRGSQRLIGSTLGPSERIVNFYRTPEQGPNSRLYVFITDTRLLFAPVSGAGAVQGNAHVDLRGLRVMGNIYRLSYGYGGVAIRTLSFAIDGAASESAAFLIQLRQQWEQSTGRNWDGSRILNSPICPPFGPDPRTASSQQPMR